MGIHIRSVAHPLSFFDLSAVRITARTRYLKTAGHPLNRTAGILQIQILSLDTIEWAFCRRTPAQYGSPLEIGLMSSEIRATLTAYRMHGQRSHGNVTRTGHRFSQACHPVRFSKHSQIEVTPSLWEEVDQVKWPHHDFTTRHTHCHTSYWPHLRFRIQTRWKWNNV